MGPESWEDGRLVVIGIDPGPHTGMSILRWPLAFPAGGVFCEVPGEGAGDRLRGLLTAVRIAPCTLIVAIEEYRRSNVGSAKNHGGLTADLVVSLGGIARDSGAHVVVRPAAVVKRWGTDLRLSKAGLLAPTLFSGHCRDSARHALFAAVREGGIPDPLSRRATRS